MSKQASICSADGGNSTGTMICQKCHNKITEGLYLTIYYSVSRRGNEDDYTRQWHQECSADHPEWKKYFIEIEKQKVRRLQELMKNKNEAVKHIYLADAIDIEEVDGEIVITCTRDGGK